MFYQGNDFLVVELETYPSDFDKANDNNITNANNYTSGSRKNILKPQISKNYKGFRYTITSESQTVLPNPSDWLSYSFLRK